MSYGRALARLRRTAVVDGAAGVRVVVLGVVFDTASTDRLLAFYVPSARGRMPRSAAPRHSAQRGQTSCASAPGFAQVLTGVKGGPLFPVASKC